LEIAYRTLFERISKLPLATSVEQLLFKYDGVIFRPARAPRQLVTRQSRLRRQDSR